MEAAMQGSLGLYAAIVAIAVSAQPFFASAQEFDQVHACDELAAHPDDPNRWAQGVYDDAIIPGPAIKACGDAVASHPETARFQFQHGRALWVAKRYQEAVEAFLQAEEFDYGPAYAYLGDAHFHGLGGVEQDEAFAVTLYQMAAEAGFEPAEATLADIASLLSDDQESTPSESVPSDERAEASANAKDADDVSGSALIQKVERWQSAQNKENAGGFNPEPFSKGRRLLSIYNGDFETLAGKDQAFQIAYFLKMNDYFGQTINFHSEACSGYFDPDLAPGVMREIMGAVSSGGGGLSDQGLQILQGIADMATSGPGALINRMTFIEAEQNAGTKDGVMLARMYGCDSPVFKRLYKNMVNYVRGSDPAEASGWPGLRLACQGHAIANNGPPDQSKKYCACITEQFSESEIPIDVVEWLQENYDHDANFAMVISQYNNLRKKIGACLL